jgi:hypothetical protein
MAARADPGRRADPEDAAGDDGRHQGGDESVCGAQLTSAAQADDEAGGVGQDAAQDLMRDELSVMQVLVRRRSDENEN